MEGYLAAGSQSLPLTRLFGREKRAHFSHSLFGGYKPLKGISRRHSDTSDSDDENYKKPNLSSFASATKRFFAFAKPVHWLFGGHNSANVIFVGNNLDSANVLVIATVIWLLKLWLDYHQLILGFRVAILGLTMLFVWSYASAFINKQPVHIPQIVFRDKPFQDVASAVSIEINRLFAVIHDVASGRDLKKYLLVVAGLWILSAVGSWANFWNLVYVAFFFAHMKTRYPGFVFNAMEEAKKHCRTFDVKVLSKIPRGPLKDKKLWMFSFSS